MLEWLFGKKEERRFSKPSCKDLINKRKFEAREKNISKKVKKITKEFGEETYYFRQCKEPKEKLTLSYNYAHGENVKIRYDGETVYYHTVSSTGRSDKIRRYCLEDEWLMELERLYTKAQDKEVENRKKELKENWNIDASKCEMCLD